MARKRRSTTRANSPSRRTTGPAISTAPVLSSPDPLTLASRALHSSSLAASFISLPPSSQELASLWLNRFLHGVLKHGSDGAAYRMAVALNNDPALSHLRHLTPNARRLMKKFVPSQWYKVNLLADARMDARRRGEEMPGARQARSDRTAPDDWDDDDWEDDDDDPTRDPDGLGDGNDEWVIDEDAMGDGI